VKWSQRFRATGSAAAGKIGGYRPRVLIGEHADSLRERIAQGDFTLRGLVAELAGRGLKVDYRTVWTFVHGEGLSFKKPSCQASKTGLTSLASGHAGKPRGRSIRGGSSSSMRPGQRPTWHPCADGVCEAHHDRIDAPWVVDGPINGELFRLYVEKILVPTLQPGDIVILAISVAIKVSPSARRSGLLGRGFSFSRPTAPISIRSSKSSPS
jgi:transposase